MKATPIARWLVFVREHPNEKWRMTGGTPHDLGNLHFNAWDWSDQAVFESSGPKLIVYIIVNTIIFKNQSKRILASQIIFIEASLGLPPNYHPFLIGIFHNKSTSHFTKSSILIGFSNYKPSILGYPQFRKPPFLGTPSYIFLLLTIVVGIINQSY